MIVLCDLSFLTISNHIKLPGETTNVTILFDLDLADKLLGVGQAIGAVDIGSSHPSEKNNLASSKLSKTPEFVPLPRA